MKNKNIYLLSDVKMNKAREAMNDAYELFKKNKEFAIYLKNHLNITHLNYLVEILFFKKDFRKIYELNKLLQKIYIAEFGKKGLKRMDPVVNMRNESREIVIGKLLERINKMMQEEGATTQDPW